MLEQRAFGLAMGAVYAAFMAVLAWVAALFHVGEDAVAMYARIFPGYRSTFPGGLIGGLYGLATGFLLGWGIAAIYNRIRQLAPRTGVPSNTAERYVG